MQVMGWLAMSRFAILQLILGAFEADSGKSQQSSSASIRGWVYPQVSPQETVHIAAGAVSRLSRVKSL
jgi:hypothetical protein